MMPTRQTTATASAFSAILMALAQFTFGQVAPPNAAAPPSPAATAVSSSASGAADYWPQWRGPNLNGTSPATGLPQSFTKDSGIKWKTSLPGVSGATPAIWGDHVFVSSADSDKNLRLLCFDRKDGKLKWNQQVATGDIVKGRGNMASPSPVTDGERVYVLYGTGDFAALDFNGKILWHRNLGTDYGRFAVMWIYGSSPLLHEGRLYVQVLQRSPAPSDYPGIGGGGSSDRESYLLAIDPANGSTIWKQVRPTNARMESMESYGTPVPHTAPDGSKQLLVIGGDCLTGHDLATGTEIWRGFGFNPKGGEWMRIVASPVSAAGLAIGCGPKKEAVLAFRTDLKGDISSTGVAWTFHEKKTPDVCTPAFYNGRLFVLDGDSQTLTCMDPKTGAKHWQGNLGDRTVVRASPTVADGKVYIINEKSTVFICSAGPEFQIVSTVALGGPEGARSTIAVSQGNLFIRTPDTLYCVGK